MLLRSLLILVIVGCCAFLGSNAEAQGVSADEQQRLSDSARVEKAVTLYQRGEYAQCADELSRLTTPGTPDGLTDPQAIERARLWLATCLIGDGQPSRAETVLEQALKARPTLRTPDPLVFPKALVDLFIQAQDRLRFMLQKEEEQRVKAAEVETEQARARARREEQRVRRLEAFAERETVVVQNERWIAALPFGIGQFQNGHEELGWVLLSSELVLAGTALGSTIAYANLQTSAVKSERASATTRGVLDSNVNRQLKTLHRLATVTGYGFAVAALAGILDAQLRFVPEHTTMRFRPLPPDLRGTAEGALSAPVSLEVRPELGVSESGLVVGFSGRF